MLRGDRTAAIHCASELAGGATAEKSPLVVAFRGLFWRNQTNSSVTPRTICSTP
jgi:hypothetical protein